jgi:hypothetical protein
VSHHTILEVARLGPLYFHLAACCVVICFELKRTLAATTDLAESAHFWSRLAPAA